ncbi:hypothetical protein ACWD25_55805, partial [Streptomyces sp. NPDC002920]
VVVQQVLPDDNRARAVTEGLRAVFVEDRGPQAGAARGEQRRGGQPKDRPERHRPARQAARALLADLVPEFAKLDATAEELAPLLSLVELPGRTRPPSGQDLLRCATGGRPLSDTLRAGLTDTRPGGSLLPMVVDSHPGSTALMLQTWGQALAAGEPLRERRGPDEPGRAGPRHGNGPSSHRRRRPARGGNQ